MAEVDLFKIPEKVEATDASKSLIWYWTDMALAKDFVKGYKINIQDENGHELYKQTICRIFCNFISQQKYIYKKTKKKQVRVSVNFDFLP